MKRQRRNARSRAEDATRKAKEAIEVAGWKITQVPGINAPFRSRFVAVKRQTEDDDSTTSLYESDYTVEGLAALVKRREREESR